MTTQFKLPELGENIESGDIVRILVSVGDNLEQDQPVLELETDKATVEVPSSVSGQVKEIYVQEGQKAQVGQAILDVEADSPDTESAQAAPSPEPDTQTAEKEPEPDQEVDRLVGGRILIALL